MTAFIKAVKVIFTLTTYNYRKPKKVTIVDDFYPGNNNEKIPYKLFKPNIAEKHNLVIYPGASPFAEEHPGMIMLGSAFARAGYTTYMPRIPLLKELKLSDELIQSFHHFYNWLLNEKKMDHNDISVVGMSFSGALILKASFQLSMKNYPPKSIFAYGTYYDFESTIEFLTIGKININKTELSIKPNPWGLIVIFHNSLSHVDIGYDTTEIQRILSLRIQDKEDESNSECLKLPEKEQEIVNSILTGQPNDEVIRIVDLFREKLKQEYQSLSPRYWYKEVKSKVFIFHGANDSMVPYTESISLGEKIKNSELFISYLYEHREISSKKGYLFKVVEVWKMIKFFQKYIQYNEN